MNRVDIDLTSFSAAQKTLEDVFQLIGKRNVILDFFILRDRDDVTIDAFMEFLGISRDPFLERGIFLSSLHVTTNNDSCAALRDLGLMDLQRAVVENTPLKRFLEALGITVQPDRRELLHNGKTYRLNPQPSGSSAAGNDETEMLNYVSFKLYKDHPICGFVCSNNVLGYGGQVNRRPEFLNNIANLLNMPELVSKWEDETTTYVLKFNLPIHRYDYPVSKEFLGDLILKTVYDYIFNGGPVSDVYSFLKPGERVHPHEIVDYFTVDEFKRYLDN
jgi:hypothetical protein